MFAATGRRQTDSQTDCKQTFVAADPCTEEEEKALDIPLHSVPAVNSLHNLFFQELFGFTGAAIPALTDHVRHACQSSSCPDFNLGGF